MQDPLLEFWARYDNRKLDTGLKIYSPFAHFTLFDAAVGKKSLHASDICKIYNLPLIIRRVSRTNEMSWVGKIF